MSIPPIEKWSEQVRRQIAIKPAELPLFPGLSARDRASMNRPSKTIEIGRELAEQAGESLRKWSRRLD